MIRKIYGDDAETLSIIHQNCFSDGWTADGICKLLSQNAFFGFADITEHMRGFILCKIVCDEIEIVTFCVLPEFRGQNIGKSLLNELTNYAIANSAKKIFLETEESNAGTIQLYESFGYRAISTRKNYYQSHSPDALVMVKTF
jgi:ribosomal-protein-alanine N-acetyltransferase